MNWHDIPSLSALRAFEAAARHGSLSAAARDLNVTHAAIGQHVRALEDFFGQSLMKREGRGMTVTEIGRRLADQLSEAFGIIASASNDLHDNAKSRAVRIAITPSFAANWLMPRIGAFWDQNPDIELELLPAGKLVDLRQDNVDVAIRYGKGGWTGAKVSRLMSAGHMAVAAASYMEGRRIECFDDLKGARWLMAKAQSEERYWVKTGGIDLDDENVTVFPTAQLTREAALAGLGVAVIPEPIADPHVKSGKLVVLCVEENSPAAYHVLTRPEIISPSRDVFVKWLKNEANI